ncbi:MAG: thymidylate synthase [Solibacillus sp.]
MYTIEKFLGLPFNIASYSLLVHMITLVAGMV